MARPDGVLDVVRSEPIVGNRMVNDGVRPFMMSFGRVFPPATDKQMIFPIILRCCLPNKSGPDLLCHCQ